MKRFIFLLLMIAICIMPVCSTAEKQEPDFRSCFWGMQKEEVKKVEKEFLEYEDQECLIYSTSLFNIDCYLLYYFTRDNKLYESGYLFVKEYVDPRSYIIDYQKVKNLIEKKYGKPYLDRENWTNDLFKDNPGTALQLGFLRFISSWSTEKTNISLILTSNNRYEIGMLLSYTSKEYASIIKQKTEQDALDQI